MAVTPRLLLPLAVAASLLMPACDGGGGSAAGQGALALEAASGAPLIERLAAAADATRFQGVRRFEVRWSEEGKPKTLVYRERVSADGEGRYALELLDLLAPPAGQTEQALFELQHQMRQGFVQRYRDFRIRDLDLFLANYQVLDLGRTVQVAGHACADLDVRRALAPERVYRVAVELQTGLPLRVREESLAGDLLALTEYESLDLVPDLAAVAFFEPARDEQPLAGDAGAAAAQLGYPPVVPKLVPDPWRPIAAAWVEDPTDPQRPWAKYTYSDGLEAIVYLHGGPVDPQTQLLQAGPGGDLVQHVSLAAWTALQGRVREQRVLAVGKAPRDLLLSLIQSAFY